uniref:Beta-2-microglobulin n=1 Tax=Monopterus albus TaxID=43700 RepID=A0A3Q3JSD6_MONAL|nr:beta-2-microglobulin-like [Monopterus albus]
MRFVFALGVLLAVYCVVDSKRIPPKIQVYSRDPGEYGVSNTVICHVSNAYPPDIKIEIFNNGEEIPNAKQTDLAFTQGWNFFLTKSATFTPQKDDKTVCRVTHGDKISNFAWEPNM